MPGLSTLKASFPGLAHVLKTREPFVSVLVALKRLNHRRRTHDEVFDDGYFSMVDETSGRGADAMAASLVRHLEPASVVDLGCGTGNLLAALRARGVRVRGTDFARAALARCRQKGIPVDVLDFMDETAMRRPLGRFDLAVNMEVAHQLPPATATPLVGYLCMHADTVLFSADPSADDRLPKTPRPAPYWRAEFQRHGFALDEALSSTLRREWKAAGVAEWLSREPMVFRRSEPATDEGDVA